MEIQRIHYRMVNIAMETNTATTLYKVPFRKVIRKTIEVVAEGKLLDTIQQAMYHRGDNSHRRM
jgi:hypothetical protein